MHPCAAGKYNERRVPLPQAAPSSKPFKIPYIARTRRWSTLRWLNAAARPVKKASERVPVELEEAIAILEDGVGDVRSPLHLVPRFFHRAKYELVSALRAAGRDEDAERHAAEIYTGRTDGVRRWHVHAGVQLAELLMSRPDGSGRKEALKISEELLGLSDVYEGAPGTPCGGLGQSS